MTEFGTPRLRGCFFVLLLPLLGDVGKAIKSLVVFCRASLLLLASFLLVRVQRSHTSSFANEEDTFFLLLFH